MMSYLLAIVQLMSLCLKCPKTSIALGNALESVKSEATMVVSAKAGDGVLEALDRLAPKLSEI